MTLLVRLERRLRAFVATLLGRFEDIDEIVQNACLVAWQKLDTFSYRSVSPDEEFLRWLCTIARYELLSLRRQRGPSIVFFDEELLGKLADMRVEQAEYFESRQRALKKCLQRLSSSDREMICNRYGGGLSVQSLASARGRSLDGIYKSLGRIRSALMSCIDRNLRQEGC